MRARVVCVLRVPAEWEIRYGANVTLLRRRDLAAQLGYHERIHPQPSFSSIIARVLDDDPEFRAQQFGTPQRVVTCEGEYGAWIAIEGRRGDARAMRWVGAVLMGEFATVLDALALAPEHGAAVEAVARELVHPQTFGMARRPRQFFYQPPGGWHGLPSGTTANWYPLDCPRNRSVIVVPPARHVDGDAAAELEVTVTSLGVGIVVDELVREPLRSHGGVGGTHVQLRGHIEGHTAAVHRELAGFVVGPWVYCMRLETAMSAQLSELRALLCAVARSFQPLPSHDETRSGMAFAKPLDLFDHWVG
jgi:hypothetical protein